MRQDGEGGCIRDATLGNELAPYYVVSDIAGLPFGGGRFDLVMANHSLYHLADVPHAVRELARPLTRDGRFVATTNSDAVRLPLLEIHWAVLDELGIASPPKQPSSFNMENGRDVLEDLFTDVDVHIYRDTIRYHSAEALLRVYLNTGRYQMIMSDVAVPQEVRDQVAPTFICR